MQGRGPTKGYQGALIDDLTAFDGVYPRRVGHIFIDHLRHPQGSIRCLQLQALPDIGEQSGFGFRSVELHATAGKGIRVDAAKNDVRVSYRGLSAAAIVTGRARL